MEIPEMLILEANELMQEVALDFGAAQKEIRISHLLSAVSFISPVAMLAMAAAGSVVLNPLSLSIMGISAMINIWNTKKKHVAKTYETFFEPHDKLVIEFDKFLREIVSENKELKLKYKTHLKHLFLDIEQLPKHFTEIDARKEYGKVYNKHMSAFVKEIKASNTLTDAFKLKRFNRLISQLKQVKILK